MEHLNDANFSEKTKEGPVVIDFYAEWCGPCKNFAPIFEETAKKITNVKFFKVNVDQDADAISEKFGVQSIPTIAFLKDGDKVHAHTGVMQRSEFENAVKEHFGL